jgi:hypothetical protein
VLLFLNHFGSIERLKYSIGSNLSGYQMIPFLMAARKPDKVSLPNGLAKLDRFINFIVNMMDEFNERPWGLLNDKVSDGLV